MSHHPVTRNLRLSGVCFTAVVLCAASGASGGDDGSRDFYPGDLGQAIAAIAIFVVLLAVLGKWAWKPLINQLRMREKKISDAIESAQDRERESQDLLVHYKARLQRAEDDSEAMLARSRKESTLAREEIIKAARHEARRSTDQATEEIARAKREALRELREKTADLATEIAARVIPRTLSEEDHRRLLSESLGEIRDRSAEDE